MTTLIFVGNSDGERRCDAKCYDAQGGKCDCVCGGRNHGAGLSQAQKNTRAMAGDLCCRLKELGAETVDFPPQFLALFEK